MIVFSADKTYKINETRMKREAMCCAEVPYSRTRLSGLGLVAARLRIMPSNAYFLGESSGIRCVTIDGLLQPQKDQKLGRSLLGSLSGSQNSARIDTT